MITTEEFRRSELRVMKEWSRLGIAEKEQSLLEETPSFSFTASNSSRADASNALRRGPRITLHFCAAVQRSWLYG